MKQIDEYKNICFYFDCKTKRIIIKTILIIFSQFLYHWLIWNKCQTVLDMLVALVAFCVIIPMIVFNIKNNS